MVHLQGSDSFVFLCDTGDDQVYVIGLPSRNALFEYYQLFKYWHNMKRKLINHIYCVCSAQPFCAVTAFKTLYTYSNSHMCSIYSSTTITEVTQAQSRTESIDYNIFSSANEMSSTESSTCSLAVNTDRYKFCYWLSLSG